MIKIFFSQPHIFVLKFGGKINNYRFGEIKMSNTIIIIILAVSLGIYQDINKPIEYELNMEDGSNVHVVLQKNSQ